MSEIEVWNCSVRMCKFKYMEMLWNPNLPYRTVENRSTLKGLTSHFLCNKDREQTQKIKRKNKEAVGKEKKEPRPVADTQTGWLGWGMVSQKHLRKADSITMATRRPDRQHVLSLLWLMPAARRTLAIARHRHTHIQWVWEANEPNTFYALTKQPNRPHMVLFRKLD